MRIKLLLFAAVLIAFLLCLRTPCLSQAEEDSRTILEQVKKEVIVREDLVTRHEVLELRQLGRGARAKASGMGKKGQTAPRSQEVIMPGVCKTDTGPWGPLCLCPNPGQEDTMSRAPVSGAYRLGSIVEEIASYLMLPKEKASLETPHPATRTGVNPPPVLEDSGVSDRGTAFNFWNFFSQHLRLNSE